MSIFVAAEMLGGLCFWGCRCLYLQSCAICFFVHMCSPSLWSSLEEINVDSSRRHMGCSFLKVQKQVATLQHSEETKSYCHCNRVERAINRVCFHLTCLSWEWRLRCEGECWKNICSLWLSWSLKSKASNVLLGMNFDAMCFMQSRVIKKCGSRYMLLAMKLETIYVLCNEQRLRTVLKGCGHWLGVDIIFFFWFCIDWLNGHWQRTTHVTQTCHVTSLPSWNLRKEPSGVWTGHRQEFNLSIMVPGLLQGFCSPWHWMKREGERMYWRGYPQKITVHLCGWLTIICF